MTLKFGVAQCCCEASDVCAECTAPTATVEAYRYTYGSFDYPLSRTADLLSLCTFEGSLEDLRSSGPPFQFPAPVDIVKLQPIEGVGGEPLRRWLLSFQWVSVFGDVVENWYTSAGYTRGQSDCSSILLNHTRSEGSWLTPGGPPQPPTLTLTAVPNIFNRNTFQAVLPNDSVGYGRAFFTPATIPAGAVFLESTALTPIASRTFRLTFQSTARVTNSLGDVEFVAENGGGGQTVVGSSAVLGNATTAVTFTTLADTVKILFRASAGGTLDLMFSQLWVLEDIT